jgi:hypothetical protein
MSTDPSDPLTPSDAPGTEPEVLPSSTPDGPQVIPTHGTPEGEPGPDPEPGLLDEPTRASNPNSGGPQGLSGDMGISSERTGPAGTDPRGFDIAGTGSSGGSVTRTDGGFDTSPTEFDAPDVSQRDVNPMPEGSETMTGAGNDPAGQGDPGNVDRTVGEPMPNPIPDEKSRRDVNDTTGPSRAQ